VLGLFLYQQDSAIASNVLNMLFYFIFVLMFIYYFLADGHKLVALLPIIGTSVMFIPAAIYLYLTGRVAAGIFFVIIYLGLSVVMEYIFKAKLVGHRADMHTLPAFLSIMGGVKLF
jgi:predicted PurR-regulated permease PerM